VPSIVVASVDVQRERCMQVRLLPKCRMQSGGFASKDGCWQLQNRHTKERTAQVCLPSLCMM
jgi:hypothetical protein